MSIKGLVAKLAIAAPLLIYSPHQALSNIPTPSYSAQLENQQEYRIYKGSTSWYTLFNRERKLMKLPREFFYTLPNLEKYSSIDDLVHNKKTRKWGKFLKMISTKSKKEQMEEVNKYFNDYRRFPYIEDEYNYRMRDYWADPLEFLKNSGDCEDYAIIKYVSLKLLGFKKEDMYVIVVYDGEARRGHAVLGVKLNNKLYILDNQKRKVKDHKSIIYTPQYMINEDSVFLFI